MLEKGGIRCVFNRYRRESKISGEGSLAEQTLASGGKAPSPTNQFLPQRLWDAEEGIMEKNWILPRCIAANHKALEKMIISGSKPAHDFDSIFPKPVTVTFPARVLIISMRVCGYVWWQNSFFWNFSFAKLMPFSSRCKI